MKSVLNRLENSWLGRLWFAQHNARVILDFERRMSVVLERATDGVMSSPYHDIDAMIDEIAATQNVHYEWGYEDGKNETIEVLS